MKLFSLILSVTVFFISLYFFVMELPIRAGFNDIIYVMLLVILMAICIVGIIINWGLLYKRARKNRSLLFIANTFSKKNK
ncbi:hypothetical protein HYN59_12855 [Flavobacterium album]|uniref:Uncharacterized protein n=1 Tax=Flavobacterium album TaxID=2175091 RepID=A0A2S1R092_9FLAO|nr:hypothetical protein HYN59_12855 [Flavobacterium album]